MPAKGKRRGYEAPAAGAFGGVATLGIGQHIPEAYPLLKYVFIYGSPILSLIYTSLVQSGFVLAVATSKRREMNKALRRVRRIRDEASASSMASPAHLKHLQATVESTEKLASRMATASNIAVVEMFTDISISDLMTSATSAIEEIGSAVDEVAIGTQGDEGIDTLPDERGDDASPDQSQTPQYPRLAPFHCHWSLLDAK
jgi:hypothetical protein